jgi:Ring finger domain
LLDDNARESAPTKHEDIENVTVNSNSTKRWIKAKLVKDHDDTLSDATSVSSTEHASSPSRPQTTLPQQPHDFDHDEESILIEIPLPGLILKHADSTGDDEERDDVNGATVSSLATTTARLGTSRLVPGFCTICLSGFGVGADICWSSNNQCEHCFHCDCIEEWLTKQMQRGHATSPICPCCRRDFIVDTHDLIMPVSSPLPPTDPNAESQREIIPDFTVRLHEDESNDGNQVSDSPVSPLQVSYGDGGDDEIPHELTHGADDTMAVVDDPTESVSTASAADSSPV